MTLESLSRAFVGRLTYDAGHETDLDKLTALCLGSISTDRRASREALLNSLGCDLMAFKFRHVVERLDPATVKLAEVLRWRAKGLSMARRHNIATLSIREWVIDMCASCLGSRQITDTNGVTRPCFSCSATGKRRYSDQERSEMLGEPANKYASAIGIAHSGIALAVHVASENAREYLRKW